MAEALKRMVSSVGGGRGTGGTTSRGVPPDEGRRQGKIVIPPIGATEPTLVMVRHGSTANNEAPEKFRGWLDLPLDAHGIQEAEDIKASFAKSPVVRIYSSDLQRAMQTASIITQDHPNHPNVISSFGLRPWDLGNWEGQAVKPHLQEMLDYETRRPGVAVPGGESFHNFVYRFLTTLRKIFAEDQVIPGVFVVVTHTRCLRATAAWLKAGARGYNLDMSVMTSPEEPAPGGVVIASLRDRQFIELGQEAKEDNE